MTNIKQRAQELLTCDELRGRVPEEVRKFLSDVVALEPIAYYDGQNIDEIWPADTYQNVLANCGAGSAVVKCYRNAIYDLGAPNDPA